MDPPTERHVRGEPHSRAWRGARSRAAGTGRRGDAGAASVSDQMAKTKQAVIEVAGREVAITNPDKVFFPQAGYTKLDLAGYYAAVAEGALRGIAGRPTVLKRYVNGADAEPFFQKRVPPQHPDWIETVELRYPSGRTAEE